MSVFNSHRAFLEDNEICFYPGGQVSEIFYLARQIKNNLGEHHYLFEQYLSGVFEALNRPNFLHALEDGFEKGNELRGVCTDVVKKKSEQADHPFYPIAKEYIDAHPLQFREISTTVEMYYSYLADQFTGFAVQEFLHSKMGEIPYDVDIGDLLLKSMKITDLVGTARMHDLDVYLKQRFMISPLVSAFSQGLAIDLLFSLQHIDAESEKQVFQLLLLD